MEFPNMSAYPASTMTASKSLNIPAPQGPHDAISFNALRMPEDVPAPILNALRVNDQGISKWTEEAKKLFMFKASCIRKTEADPPFRFHFVHSQEELSVKWYPCFEDDRPRSRRGVLLVTAPSLDGNIFIAGKERGTRHLYRIWLGSDRGFATGWDIIKSVGSADEGKKVKGKSKKGAEDKASVSNDLPPDWHQPQQAPEQRQQSDKGSEHLAEMVTDPVVKSVADQKDNDGENESFVLPSIENEPDVFAEQRLLVPGSSESNSINGVLTPVEATPAASVGEMPALPNPQLPKGSDDVRIDVFFIDVTGHVVRTKPWEKCYTVEKFFVQVAASRIIGSMTNEFALAAQIDGMEVRLTKYDEDDFNSLKAMIVAYMATCGDAKHGIVEVTCLTEYRPDR